MKSLKKIGIVDIIAWTIATFALVIILVPFMNVISLSLSRADSILRGDVSIWPIGFNLDSYVSIMQSPRILTAYWNSIRYTTVTVVISLFLGAITAYPLSRKFLPGRKFLISMVVFTMFFSGGLIPFYILMQNLGLMDNIWALVIPWAIPAFELFLLKNYFENMPHEIYEAAAIDGASEYTMLARIYVPLAKPIFATLTIFFALWQWNAYMVPLMYITTPSRFPLQLVLNEMLIQEQAMGSGTNMANIHLTPQGVKNATIVLSVLPLLLLYPFVQKYFISGIYIGSVKG